MRRRRRGNSKDFLWPFILMIGVGLVVVLGVQLVMSFFAQKESEMRNKANFYIDIGRAEVMEWGEKDWDKAYSGGVILEGDSIKTKSSSRGVLVLYNETEVRFSENTELSVTSLDSKGEKDYLVLDLDKGEIWVNQLTNEKGSVDVTIQIDNMNIYSTGTEFAVTDMEVQAVRVVEGSVIVEFVEREGTDIVIDEVEIGVGQQIEMSESDVADLLARRNMSFLEAISEEWEESYFYVWNWNNEAIVLVEEEEPEVENDEDPITNDETEEEVVVEEEEEIEYDDPVLTLTNPDSSPSIYDGDQIYITGEVEGYASKIVVRSYTEEGTADDYQLGLFEPGDTEFSYNAAHIYENLFEGENEYLVMAYDYDGEKAVEMRVVINIPEGTFAEEEVEENDEDPIDVEEESEGLACGELTAPVVTDVDWEEWDGEVFVLDDADAVRVEGTVECAAGILINEYQLTFFELGDTTWAYVASTEYNNLFEGETEYEVFAIDEDGNRSDPAYFWVDYVPSEEEVE